MELWNREAFGCVIGVLMRPAILAPIAVLLTTELALAVKPTQDPATIVVTNLNDSGPGSLRQALIDAPAGGVITFADSVAGVIALTGGQLETTKNVTIQGPGADVLAISGNGASRVFFNAAGITATISGVTIQDGVALGAWGGGISNFGTLTVTDATLRTNSADLAGGALDNCGWCGGTLTVTRSLLDGNQALWGGAVWNDSGTVTLTHCTLSNNSADNDGGGIASAGTLIVINSDLSGNSADVGGGISNFGALTVTGSTLSSNSADSVGGGINNFAGPLTLTNSTLAGNTAASGGGGLWNHSSGTVTMTNATLAGNVAGTNGGGIVNLGGAATLSNTIVAGNGLTNCVADPALTDGGNNLEYPGTSCLFAVNAVLADPLLGALTNNGGPTRTMSLPPNSPAVDAGGSSACNAPAPPPLTNTGADGLDQRGALRGADGNGDGAAGCDIGAFELNDADLAVTIDAPATAISGQPLTYVIVITNNGPLADPLVVLRENIPRGTAFLSATPSQGTCSPPGRKSSVVLCDIGLIEAGNNAGATIEIRVAPSATGPLQNVAQVSGSRFDPNHSNNTSVSITQASK